jgi:amino acid transporter
MIKKRKINFSIKVINYFLFLAIIYNSVLFFVFEKFKNYSVYFLFFNIVLLLLFYWINKKYELEYLKSREYTKILNEFLLSKNNNIKDIDNILK